MKCLKLVALISIFMIGVSLRSYADSASVQQQRTVSVLNDLINHLNDIVGIEAIVADGTPSSAFYSKFGHAMLRFVRADGEYGSDPVISFEANITSARLSPIKGIFGGYGVHIGVRDFNTYWHEYVDQYQRPLVRYVILSTPEDRARLLYNLREWAEHPSYIGRYTFLKNNCVGALAKLLEFSDFPAEIGINPVIPIHFGEWLRHSYLSPWPSLKVDTLSKLFPQVAERLQISVANLRTGTQWPQNAATIIESHFSDLQIKELLLQLGQMPETVRLELGRKHNFNNGGATLDQAMSFEVLPQVLYQLCTTESCTERQLSLAKKIWTADEIPSALKDDRFVLKLAAKNKAQDPYFIPAPPQYFKNYQLLAQ